MAITERQGWSTAANPGKLYPTQIEAQRADGRERLLEIIEGCITGYDYRVDLDDVMARAEAMILALRDATATV